MDARVVSALQLPMGLLEQLSPGAYIVLMGFGFLVGTAGHVVRSKTLVAAGVVMVFLATVLLPLTAHVSQ